MRKGKYVLRKHNVNPDLPWYFAAYNESATAMPTEFNGKRSATIFLNDPNSVSRATKLGWIDETDLYNKKDMPESLTEKMVVVDQEPQQTKPIDDSSSKAKKPKKKRVYRKKSAS